VVGAYAIGARQALDEGREKSPEILRCHRFDWMLGGGDSQWVRGLPPEGHHHHHRLGVEAIGDVIDRNDFLFW